MLNTIIFDLDGTLLDTLGDLSHSVNYALRTHSLPERSVEEIQAFLGNGIRYLMTCAVGDVPMSNEHFEEVFQTFRTHYVEHCLDSTCPYPGIMPLLEQLKARRVKMAIVSNKLHPAVQDLNEHFFKGYISSAVGESEKERRKPNPDAVLRALQELGSRPDEAIYIGDSEVDLATAENAGLRCGLVLWGFRNEDFLRSLEGVTEWFAKPDEILDLF